MSTCDITYVVNMYSGTHDNSVIVSFPGSPH